jgi:tRNA(Arg) A34 adenosine deaminase TadA
MNKYNIFIDTIIDHIIPQTKIAISKGNKIFGAAILKKSDYSLICVGTNNEMENPLWHGEISALKNFYEIASNVRVSTKDCIFVSTHEPCSLCLSAITWTGFDNFYYFFPYIDTNNKFNIPHDLKVLKEVFKINQGNYNKENSYWKSYSIIENINLMNDPERTQLNRKVKKINEIYCDLSDLYQKFKTNNNIPLN